VGVISEEIVMASKEAEKAREQLAVARAFLAGGIDGAGNSFLVFIVQCRVFILISLFFSHCNSNNETSFFWYCPTNFVFFVCLTSNSRSASSA
jgi:hypothetical protein